jgi:seryl-tRNA synthetase
MDEMKLLTEVDARSRDNTRRIEDIERRQDNLDKLTTTMGVMANEQEHIKKDVGEIKDNVRELTAKPGKRWEGIVDKLIWLLVSGGVGFLLACLGFK